MPKSASQRKARPEGHLAISELSADPFLKRTVEVLIEGYQPDRIYLFGSKARGDAGPDSDYDLLVVVPRSVPWRLRKKVHYALWDAGLRQATDVVIWTRESFDEQLQLKASLPSVVVAEGKLLYEAR